MIGPLVVAAAARKPLSQTESVHVVVGEDDSALLQKLLKGADALGYETLLPGPGDVAAPAHHRHATGRIGEVHRLAGHKSSPGLDDECAHLRLIAPAPRR